MRKKGPLVGVIIMAVIVGVVVSYAAVSSFEDANIVHRQHGTILTTMGSPILGDPDAPVTIVEFGDYQCHQCYNWFHKTKPIIEESYIESGKANLVFVDLAFLGRDSPKAAQASYCADDQGMYWEYHDTLYDSQESTIDGGWASTERLKGFALSIGLDTESFNSCLDSGKHSKRVQFNISEAKKIGASGTPTFVIVSSDGTQSQKIVGAQPYSVFRQVLDSMI